MVFNAVAKVGNSYHNQLQSIFFFFAPKGSTIPTSSDFVLTHALPQILGDQFPLTLTEL